MCKHVKFSSDNSSHFDKIRNIVTLPIIEISTSTYKIRLILHIYAVYIYIYIYILLTNV